MAQERKKRRIVLASVLKPVNDPRMLERMAVSLSNHGWENVVVIGYPSSSPVVTSKVRLIGMKPFKRLSPGRLAAEWRVLRQVLQIRPEVIIFNTHELLVPAMVVKVLFGSRIIYDVRENYFRNIIHTDTYPAWIRWPLALAVRWKEKLLAPAIDHFLLAERGYEKEFRFHRGGWTVVENKPVVGEALPRPANSGTRLLFSGTLAASTGIFLAIKLADVLYQRDHSITLVIAGFAPQAKTRHDIMKAIEGKAYIRLVGGDRFVPHDDIMAEVAGADFGILAYPQSPHVENCRPTKLFEYLSMGLPIILEPWWPWTAEFSANDPFLFTHFLNPDPEGLLRKMTSRKGKLAPVPGLTWKEEEERFLNAVGS